MFFVFGWGHTTHQNISNVMGVRCPNCNNLAMWHAFCRTTWFTLFFVPVIPYKKYYFLHCGVCDRGVELSRDEFSKSQILANLHTDYVENKRLSREQYQTAFNEIGLRKLHFNTPTTAATQDTL